MPLKLIAVIATLAFSWPSHLRAGDVVKITIPRHSELTPVQRLNRAGVDAIQRKQLDKAATLFYKAYLFDPADPFTLNNLGYISEVQGELDRAQHFYALAAKQGSDANIDRSNARQLRGKPMQYAFQSLQEDPMRLNRMNVDALTLLSEDRGFEAAALLRVALSLDPQNPFTRNNMGVADETIGDYENALKEYDAAADLHSSELVVVTLNRSWRGKPVSEMAASSARRLEERMRKMDPTEEHAILLTMRGVSAANQNDWMAAKQYFLNAYSIDPTSAFTLNNRGYVAEKDGDLETAQFFYEKARLSRDSNDRVGVATDRSAKGKKLFAVATDSNLQVDRKLEKYSEDRRQQTGPIELTPRDNSPTGESTVLPTKSSSAEIPSAAASSDLQHN